MTQLEKVLGPDLTQILKNASRELSAETAKDVLPSSLVSPEQQAALLETQTMESFEKLSADYEEAAHILLATLDVISRTRPDINYEKAVSELRNASMAATTETFSRALLFQENEQPLTNETLSALTDTAKYIFQEKQYAKAMSCFSLLYSIDPDSYANWVGFGHSAFHTQQYDTAILAYYMATSLDPVNPWPLLWAANTCENKQDLTAAHQLLERAKVVACDSEVNEYGALVKEIDERLKK